VADKEKRSTLIISRSSPYGSTLAQSALDYALAAAAFEQPLKLLFMADGVLQLLPGQETADSHQKNLGKRLSSLPLYGVDSVYADSQSLSRYGLRTGQLLVPTQAVDAEGIRSLLREHDQVVSF